MSRPTTHDDLEDYVRKGHVVASIPSTYITRYPSLGQHLLAALAEADRLGLTVTTDGDIVIDLTTDELDTQLKSAQRSWDYDEASYRKAVAGEPIEQWRRSGVDRWARTEGMDPVAWDASAVAL